MSKSMIHYNAGFRAGFRGEARAECATLALQEDYDEGFYEGDAQLCKELTCEWLSVEEFSLQIN